MMQPRRLAAVAAVCIVVVCGSTLAGCTAARNGLGTTDSLCFHVLPEARGAIGKSASFAGVRLLPIGDVLKAIELRAIEHSRHGTPPPLSLVRAEHERDCLVAFRGDFSLAHTRLGWAARPGPYRAAIVVVRPSNDKVVVTILLRRVPGSIEFEHRYAFVT